METIPDNSGLGQLEVRIGNRQPLPTIDEYASLIIRLWRLPGDQATEFGVDWRSEVEHIQSGGIWVFSNSAELEKFLSDFLRR